MESKMLKPYMNYTIEKSYDVDANGKAKPDTVIYTACDMDENVYDADITLAGIKRKIDAYVKTR